MVARPDRISGFGYGVKLECREGALRLGNPKKDLPRSAKVDDDRAFREKKRDRNRPNSRRCQWVWRRYGLDSFRSGGLQPKTDDANGARIESWIALRRVRGIIALIS